jgi:YHS domain-containing protein
MVLLSMIVWSRKRTRKQKEEKGDDDDLQQRQLICPVMKTPLYGPTPYVVNYQGKDVSLCCSWCQEEFLKNPERYI